MNERAIAQAAKNLADDPTFKEVIEGVKARQAAVFLTPNSSTEEREEAHAIVRALGKIDEEIRRMMNAGIVEQFKQEKRQHRGSD